MKSVCVDDAAVLYTRYSSHAQRDVSIDQQIKECRKFAERLGLRIIDVYADRALTGTNDKRPEFQRMIKDAEKGGFSYVIVYTLDRFARDRYDSAVYKRQLRNNGVKVLSAMENISDDPTGVLMESMLEGLAEYYSKELSRKITRGMRDNAEKCMVNGVLELGFKKGKDGRYEIDEAEAAVVRESFARVDAGEPFVDIFNDYNRRGITTKRGGKWNRSSFNKMLTNEKYRGIYIFDDIRVEGGVPRIIEDDLFFRVANRLQTKPRARNSPLKRRRENGVYLLTGKLFCGKCKSPMIGFCGKSTASTPYTYYGCQKRRVEKECDKSHVRRDWAEYQITKRLQEVVLNDTVINWMADSVMTYLSSDEEIPEITFLKAQLAETRTALKNIMSAIEQGIITNTTKARLTELEADEAMLSAKLSAAEQKKTTTITKDIILAFLQTFREGDPNDKEYQELIIDTFLISAYLYDDGWRLVFNHTGDTDEMYFPFDVEDLEGAAEAQATVCLSTPKLHQSRARRTRCVRLAFMRLQQSTWSAARLSSCALLCKNRKRAPALQRRWAGALFYIFS